MNSTRWQRVAWLLFLGLVLAMPLRAEVALQLGDIQAQAWQAKGVRLVLVDAAADAYVVQLRIEQLVMPDGSWKSIELSCPDLRFEDGYHCGQASVSAEGPYGPQHLQGTFHYLDAEHWRVDLDGLRFAKGRWRLTARADGDWQAELTGKGVSLAGILALLPAGILPDWDWQGGVHARLLMRGRGAEPRALDARLKLSAAGYNSPDGLQAAEGVMADVVLKADRVDGRWRGQGSVKVDEGQWYSDPVFVNLGRHPLQVNLAGQWRPDGDALTLRSLRASLGALLQVTGQGQVLPLAKSHGQVGVALKDLAGLYPVLVQPLAFGTAFDRLEVAGSARLELDWQGGAVEAIRLALKDLHLDDVEGRFGISDLAGDLAWQAGALAQKPQPSRLKWQSGHVYRIAFGASQADLVLLGGSLRLMTPLDLPLLAGQLHVPELVVEGLRTENVVWHTAMAAEELSLPELTAALGWPALDGTLSVQIPAVRYGRGELVFDGELIAEAFDGTVRVNGLKLTDPLGAVPGLEAEASLRGLDLERLTRVFDLGRITGRLDGDIQGLQLVGWEPVSFQAELRTPPGDTSRHRISQRAVENLTALGNTGAAALSGTFLRVFESFAYDRLLLTVNLAGQVAQLDGIAHPDGGYYLVKGAGLPRIDVIGRNRQVAWRDLVERLKRITLKGVQVR